MISLKTLKLRNLFSFHPMCKPTRKRFSHKTAYLLVITNNLLLVHFFSVLSADLESGYNSAFFLTRIDLFEGKKLAALFCEKYMYRALYYLPLWFCLCGEGDAKILLKCHALCPICLTYFTVHKARTSKRIPASFFCISNLVTLALLM